MNVFVGLADAGMMCDYSFAELQENKSPKDDEVPPKALVVIGTTWSIPTWVFTARKDLDKKTISKVVDALLQLNKDRPQHLEILEEMELGGFARAQESDFDGLKNDFPKLRFHTTYEIHPSP